VEVEPGAMTQDLKYVDLPQISRNGGAAFRLALSNAPELACEEIVRRVTGKRLVCRGTWNNRTVYAKLFIGDQAQRYAGRDLNGVNALAQAGILTPGLLHAGPIAGAAGEALVFEAIADSVNAEQAWDDMPQLSEARLDLAKLLVAEVAHHHQAGLIQTDLYLKNFLLQGEKIYTLDGDGIRLLRFCRRHRSLHNLAVLLSKFDVLEIEAWLPQLLRHYADKRGMALQNIDLLNMQRQIAAQRHGVVKGYVNEKIFRTCTDIHVESGNRFFLAIARPYLNAGLRQVLNQPDSLLQEGASKRLKSGNTCTVSLNEVEGRKIVVKRYNIKNFWHGLGRALRVTRAAASWSNAHRLMMYDIPTAAPIALLEKRYGIIRRQAYLLAEYIDAPDVDAFFADATVDMARKTQIANSIARMFYKLYLLRIEHGDFKATNMKIVDGQPYLIDLDSMREYRCNWRFSRRHVRDLRRFMRNWQADAATTNILIAAFRAIYKDTSPLDKAGIKPR
jgi:tRNA A-37 threonylcarbamoyl transferase component Bud32